MVLSSLKKKKEATVADVIAATGLPKYQVEESMKAVADEYRGHFKVTESGEILYYFPYGMKSRYTGFGPTAKRFFSAALKITGKILAFLFKIWIVVMLVGYFVLFIALLILAFLASIAGSASRSDKESRSRDSGGGFLSFYFTARIVDLFITIWLYSGMNKKKGEKGRPLHKSVFAFVFGEDNINKNWDQIEKRMIISFIQQNKGVITLEEIMALTGRSSEDAQVLLNSCLYEFEGEPNVTENGTLYYRFPELMKKGDEKAESFRRVKKSLYPFNTNKPSTNKWIGVLNAVNLLFGTYFFGYSLFVTAGNRIMSSDALASFYVFVARLFAKLVENPLPLLLYGLGLVPLVFSILFYLIPLVRRIRENSKNNDIKAENFRQTIYSTVFGNPYNVNPDSIQPANKDEMPARWESVRENTLKELGTTKGVDIEETPDGKPLYSYPEIDRELKDMAAFRKSLDVSQYKLGKTVFDSGE